MFSHRFCLAGLVLQALGYNRKFQASVAVEDIFMLCSHINLVIIFFLVSTRNSWGLVVKSTLSPRYGSVALRQLKHILKRGQKVKSLRVILASSLQFSLYYRRVVWLGF